MTGRKKEPCAVQRSRASRAVRTRSEIIADFDRYTKYAAWMLIALMAFVTLSEVLGWC